MNAAQIRTLQLLTERLTRSEQYTTKPGEFMNGPIVFRVSAIEGAPGEYIFQAWNERANWFESSKLVTCAIGKRGGLRNVNNEGFSGYCFENLGTYRKHQ